MWLYVHIHLFSDILPEGQSFFFEGDGFGSSAHFAGARRRIWPSNSQWVSYPNHGSITKNEVNILKKTLKNGETTPQNELNPKHWWLF